LALSSHDSAVIHSKTKECILSGHKKDALTNKKANDVSRGPSFAVLTQIFPYRKQNSTSAALQCFVETNKFSRRIIWFYSRPEKEIFSLKFEVKQFLFAFGFGRQYSAVFIRYITKL